MEWYILGVITGLFIGIIPVSYIVNCMDKDKESKAADVCEGYCKECSIQIKCNEKRNHLEQLTSKE